MRIGHSLDPRVADEGHLPTVTMRCRRSSWMPHDRIQQRAGKSSRCVEKLCRSSRSRSRSLRVNERAGAKTVRRKDVTTSEANTWCADHKCKAPPTMLTGQSKRAWLRQEVSTDNETHDQRSGGCGKRAGALISSREALAGVHPGGRSRKREAHSHPLPGHRALQHVERA